MIIDFHTHVFPARIASSTVKHLSLTAHIPPHTDGTAEGLLASMKDSGIDLSVILPVATNDRQVSHINESAAVLNERYSRDGRGLISFGAIHPDCEDFRAELRRIRELGLKGIKVHPVYQGTDLDDIRYLRIFEEAASLGLTVIAHAGLDIGFPGVVRCSPKMALHVVDEIGSFPFVLAHMGGWRNWDEVLELLPETGVYLDTSFSIGAIEPLPDGYWDGKDLSLLNDNAVLEIIRRFGADHILFGSDSPWTAQKDSLAHLKNLREDHPVEISRPDLEMILGGNAGRLLGAR